MWIIYRYIQRQGEVCATAMAMVALDANKKQKIM